MCNAKFVDDELIDLESPDFCPTNGESANGNNADRECTKRYCTHGQRADRLSANSERPNANRYEII